MYKRIISGLVAFVLCFGMVPLTAAATEVPVVLVEEPIEEITEPSVETPLETVVVTEEEALSVTGIAIDEINFPDPVFRAYVLDRLDTGYSGYDEYGETWIGYADGILSPLEIENTDRIAVPVKTYGVIQNLEGIGYFRNITSLDIRDHQLTSLDVSGYTALATLFCDGNQLTSLNVSGCTALTDLYCYGNQLISLDVSDCTALTDLWCWGNQLTSLDVSNNLLLEYLTAESNQLTNLDVSKNTVLTNLGCSRNQLTSLDVSNNTALTYLYCNENQLTNLDVSNNTALTYLNCGENQLSQLDVSRNTALIYLYCRKNQLASLDVSGFTALTRLECLYNQLTSLDISGCTALTDIDCRENQLTSLDVSGFTALKSLVCYGNQLSSLDISGCTALETLSCGSNLLTSLDVSSCTALIDLFCSNNPLDSLDVRNCTALTELLCSDSRLTNLNVSSNTALVTFGCSNNEYNIMVASDGAFNLSTLPGNFDVSKASKWQGGTVKGNILTVSDGVEKVTYNYDCGNGKIMYTSLLVTRISAPKEPTVTIANNTVSGKPVLSWAKVDGAVKYQIYRSKTGKAGSFGLINTVKTLTTTNNNAVAGTKYYYKVRAVFSDNTKSDYSNVVTITCDLARPTGLKVTNDAATGKNKISWNAVEGAVKYQVWHSTTGKAGSFKLLYTTKNLSHIHKAAVAGKMHYYKVKAVHSNTAANSALTGWVQRTCDLAKPTGVKVTAAATGKNKITWNAVPGAAKYQVWFSKTGKAGSFTCLMTTKNLTHTHKGGVSGQKYFYKVKAIHTNTNANSAFSIVVSRIADDGEWAAYPDGIRIEHISGGSYNAHVMIVRDPSKVSIGTSTDEFSESIPGKRIAEIMNDNPNVSAAINAGAYNDDGSNGSHVGSTPLGLVMSGGECVWSSGYSSSVGFAGFDENNVLVVSQKNLSKSEAEKLKIRDGCCFGPALLINGEVVCNYNTGTAARTAIGQRTDGAVIFVCIDGHTTSSPGGTYTDIIDIMVKYDAVNACNMTGVTSSVMMYRDVNGQIGTAGKVSMVNTYPLITSQPRRMPTYWLVRP